MPLVRTCRGDPHKRTPTPRHKLRKAYMLYSSMLFVCIYIHPTRNCILTPGSVFGDHEAALGRGGHARGIVSAVPQHGESLADGGNGSTQTLQYLVSNEHVNGQKRMPTGKKTAFPRRPRELPLPLGDLFWGFCLLLNVRRETVQRARARARVDEASSARDITAVAQHRAIFCSRRATEARTPPTESACQRLDYLTSRRRARASLAGSLPVACSVLTTPIIPQQSAFGQKVFESGERGAGVQNEKK